MLLSSIWAAAIKSAKDKLGKKKADAENTGAQGPTGNPTYEPSVKGDGADATGLSQWQALQRKMLLPGSEPLLPESDVATLLKAVFREHMLTCTPEFAKYFATDGNVRGAAEVEASFAASAPQPELPDALTPNPDSDTPHPHPHLRPHGARGTWPALCRAWGRFRSSPLRLRIYLTLSHPEYSNLALVMGMLFLSVIVINTATFCVESVPRYENTPLYDRLVMVDYACLAVFTVEFLLRLATCPALTHFVTDPMNWLDAASILPFYVELIVLGPSSQVASQTRIVRLLRLLRILRMLRATARFRNLQVVVDSLVASGDVIAMLALLLLVLLVVSSTVIYFIEDALVPGTWFDSIPSTMYYMHVTLTTTGYGDLYAQSAWGRFVAGVFMLLCMVTFSLPISVVGGNFSNLWSRYTAIRDGLARSGAAWATRRRLRGLAARHAGALDDLVSTVNGIKCELEDGAVGGGAGDEGELGGVAALSARLGALRQLLAEAQEAGEGGAKLSDVREGVAELKMRLQLARRRQDELQALLAVSGRLVGREVSESLDSLHSAHKAMAGWAVDGAWLAGRGRALLADLQALRQVVEEEEAWLVEQAAQAAAQAGGQAGALGGRGARRGDGSGQGVRGVAGL